MGWGCEVTSSGAFNGIFVVTLIACCPPPPPRLPPLLLR